MYFASSRFFCNEDTRYPDYINIIPSKNCSSYIGYMAHQPQNLQMSFTDDTGDVACDRAHGTIIHELMHALGKCLNYGVKYKFSNIILKNNN